jgi:hypothetical protein
MWENKLYSLINKMIYVIEKEYWIVWAPKMGMLDLMNIHVKMLNFLWYLEENTILDWLLKWGMLDWKNIIEMIWYSSMNTGFDWLPR